MLIFFICQVGMLLVFKSHSLFWVRDGGERMNESAGTALEMKGDMQNKKHSKDCLRTFQLKLSKEFTSSPLLAVTVPAEERDSLQR